MGSSFRMAIAKCPEVLRPFLCICIKATKHGTFGTNVPYCIIESFLTPGAGKLVIRRLCFAISMEA